MQLPLSHPSQPANLGVKAMDSSDWATGDRVDLAACSSTHSLKHSSKSSSTHLSENSSRHPSTRQSNQYQSVAHSTDLHAVSMGALTVLVPLGLLVSIIVRRKYRAMVLQRQIAALEKLWQLNCR